MILADARQLPIATNSMQCCVTSPPYWGLRDYGAEGQIGLESTPTKYVAALVAVFREVRRTLRDDGVLWLNLGDSYASGGRGGNPTAASSGLEGGLASQEASIVRRSMKPPQGLKPKDLVGIPWRVAFALQADGWYLRSDVIEEVELFCPCGCGFRLEERIWRYSQDREVIWSKPNCMPESVTDRPTRSHEYVFLLTKSERYYYAADAIRSPFCESTLKQFDEGYRGHARKIYDGTGAQNPSDVKRRIVDKQRGHGRRHAGFNDRWDDQVDEYAGKHAQGDPQDAARRVLRSVKAAREAGGEHNNPFGRGANARSVWTISPQPFQGAHFATMPEKLVERCVLAGSRPGDWILDPFLGSGTVSRVAISLGRKAVGCDLQRAYLPLQRERLQVTRGLPLEMGDEAAS
jgi:DNA modification methylase